MSALPVLLAWLAVLVLELVFAWGAMVRPTAEQLLLEVLALGILAGAQLRLAKAPWQASAWWPGALCIWVPAVALGPTDQLDRLFYALGTGLVMVLAVRALAARAERVWLTLPFAILGALGARWLVLDRAAEADVEQFGDTIAVADATGRLGHELSGLTQGQGPAGDGPPLVLISVDTLRADHAVETETWRRLLARGHGWKRAVSTSSWTLPAVTSMHTGVPSEVHGAGVRPGGGYQLGDPDLPVLAEDLDAAGYRNAAFVTNSWLETSMGFSRGFDVFLHSNEAFPHRLLIAGMPKGPLPVDGAAVVDRALSWLDGQPEAGWFLWVHLVDPHMPYFNATEPLCAGIRDGALRGGQLTTETERQQLRDCYAHEVAYTDAQLLRLLDGLESKGVFDSGLVVFTADHGEEFWDHGGTEHGHSHHTEVVEVAQAVAGKAVSPRGNGPASVMDVASTLRAAAGLDLRGGIDLRQGVPDDRIVTTFGNNYYRVDRSARSAETAVIVHGEPRTTPAVQAYDRVVDPLEQAPLAQAPIHLLETAQAIEDPEARAAAELNEASLRALGYLPE